MLRRYILISAIFAIIVAFVVVVVVVPIGKQNIPQGDYYSVQERRMPCGRILRREVIHTGDAWRKTVSLLDAEGRVLETKTRTVEPEHCDRIRAGQFVPGLWRDCTVAV